MTGEAQNSPHIKLLQGYSAWLWWPQDINCTKRRGREKTNGNKHKCSPRKLKVLLGSGNGASDTSLGLKLLGTSSSNLALLHTDSVRDTTGASKHLEEAAAYSHSEPQEETATKGPLSERKTPRALEDRAESEIPKNPFGAHPFQVTFPLPGLFLLTLHQKNPTMKQKASKFPPFQATC